MIFLVAAADGTFLEGVGWEVPKGSCAASLVKKSPSPPPLLEAPKSVAPDAACAASVGCEEPKSVSKPSLPKSAVAAAGAGAAAAAAWPLIGAERDRLAKLADTSYATATEGRRRRGERLGRME